MFEHTDYEFLDGEGLEEFIQKELSCDSDKENLRPTVNADIISKRKRDHSESKTPTAHSSSTQTMDEFDLDTLSEYMGAKRFRGDSVTDNPEDSAGSSMNVDPEPEVVQRFVVCPIYSGHPGKRKKLFCSTPHRVADNVITIAVPMHHPDISDCDSSSLTDSTRTTATEKSLTTLNGTDSGIAMETAAQESASFLDIRNFETPKMKKSSRKQTLALKFDVNETTDDDDEPVVVKVEPKRRGRPPKRPKPADEQESVAEPSTAESGRSSRSRTREAVQTRSAAPKRPKVAHICHVCNVEVATATILRYHLRKCGKTPDKPNKK